MVRPSDDSLAIITFIGPTIAKGVRTNLVQTEAFEDNMLEVLKIAQWTAQWAVLLA